MERLQKRIENCLYWFAFALVVYMPLHVFLTQSLSTVTGGLEVWKAAKDILIVMATPLALWVLWRRGAFKNKLLQMLLWAGVLYGVLHFLYVLFDRDDDTVTTIIASVYNVRLLGYLILGMVVGVSASKYRKKLLVTVGLIVASLVALFGVAQYFLPHDLLTHVGYSVERGVKPMFFIDDNPDLPRVMSTLRDPNSLGAYLIVPILLTGYALISKRANNNLFTSEFRRGALVLMLLAQSGALFLTFSRGALLGLLLSVVTLLCIVYRGRAGEWLKKFWYVPLVTVLIFAVGLYIARDSSLVQDYILHASQTSDDFDPNEKRVILQQDAIEAIAQDIDGKGPGSAGLVSIRNPKGGVLTENYYLQIAYEVGWLGIATFLFLIGLVTYMMFKVSRTSELSHVLLASFVGYVFISLLIHLWSNEAVALQWWLLSGIVILYEQIIVLKDRNDQ